MALAPRQRAQVLETSTNDISVHQLNWFDKKSSVFQPVEARRWRGAACFQA